MHTGAGVGVVVSDVHACECVGVCAQGLAVGLLPFHLVFVSTGFYFARGVHVSLECPCVRQGFRGYWGR